jgi:hypothetical protein
MTVGIGAIAHDGEDNPNVVMAADRMVTYRSSIEYEDTDSKLEVITERGEMTAVAVGSGNLSFIDDVIRRLENRMVEQAPTSMRELLEMARESYQEMERDIINNNVLSTFDIEVSDLFDEDVDIPPQFEDRLMNDIGSVREELRNTMNILFGGVYDGDAELYTLSTPDFSDHTSTGYAVVGSGQRSAESLFIRNRYDSDEANLTEAIFSVGESKIQAEERQGVGQEMDVAVVNSDGVREIQDIEGLRESITRIEEEQSEIRQSIMGEWE